MSRPTGCQVLPNPRENTTTIACDKNISEVGDRCDRDNMACNLDGTALLRCQNGALAVAQKCKCTVLDDAPACR